MFENIAEAIQSQDYQTADEIIQQIRKEEPENPWLEFYSARLDEANGNLEAAGQRYRQMLRDTTNPKIIAQTRQAIGRLEAIEREQRQLEDEQRQTDLAKAKAAPGSQEVGVLVLEPIAADLKQAAAQALAKVMQIDPYSARLQLPSRAWRLYRTGPIGELLYYTPALKEANIPCFCTTVNAIRDLKVYEVNYFESVTPQATIVYEPAKGRQATLSFDWSEVTQRVEGLLPIFEEYVERDSNRKLEHKTKILDYAKFCDLHLPEKKSILRLCDHNYEFQQGATFSQKQQVTDGKMTTRDNWNALLQFLQQQLTEIPVWSDFTIFAETAIDFEELLKLIEPHITLLRREETPWDPAFQLYSGLAFVRGL